MALPPGVTTAVVTFGSPASGFSGEDVSTTLTITPSHSVYHASTGAPLLAFTIKASAGEGLPGSVVLPHTDQAGFLDASGNAFTNWAYTAEGSWRSGSSQINFKKNFQLPTGQETVDLDLIPNGTIGLPVTAPTITVTSFLGKTGAIEEADLADLDLGGGLGDAGIAELVTGTSETKTALDAHYAPVSLAETVDGKLTAPSGGTTGQVLAKTSGGIGWTDPATGGGESLTYANDPALARYREGIATRKTAPAVIVGCGSSTNEGWNATYRGAKWLDMLGQSIAQIYGGGGTYILTNDPAWGITGTVADVSEGVAARSLRLEAGATMTATFDDTDGFKILHCEGSAQAGEFTYSIDGAAPVTVTPAQNGSFRHWGERLVNVTSRGRHTIKITAVAQTTINGLYVHRGDKFEGVQVWNSGRAGARASDFGSFYIWQRMERLAPSLVFLVLGANDYGAQTTIATYKTELQNRINTMKAWAKVPSILLIGTYRRLDVSTPAPITWEQYLTAMKEVAAANPGVVAYREISSLWPQSQTADVFDVIDTDGIHMTNAGHLMYHDQVAAMIGVPPNSKRSPLEASSFNALAAQYTASSLGLADGANVTTWAASGSRPVAATPAGGTAPIYRATGGPGGRPGVEFTAASSTRLYADWVAAGAASIPIPSIVVAATLRTAATVADGIVFTSSSGAAFQFDISGSAFRMGASGGIQITSDSGIVLPSTDYAIVLVFAGSGNARMFINALTPNKTGTTASATLSALRFGSNAGGVGGFSSYTINEVDLFARTFTDAECRELMKGLAGRIGLAVS